MEYLLTSATFAMVTTSMGGGTGRDVAFRYVDNNVTYVLLAATGFKHCALPSAVIVKCS